jgi:hypothetical protein
LFYGFLTVGAIFLNNASATSSLAGMEPSRPGVAKQTATSINLSIDQLVPLIIANNPDLRVSLMAQTAARAGITSAQAFYNPRIEMTRGTNTARIASANTGPLQGWAVSQFIEIQPFATPVSMRRGPLKKRADIKPVSPAMNWWPRFVCGLTKAFCTRHSR